MGLVHSIVAAFFPSAKRSSTSFNDPRHLRGREGEERAARHLKEHGYKVLYRNYRPENGGEIDIVARHGKELVFVEVKTRGSDDFGAPVEAVSRQQQQRLFLGALEWLRLLGSPAIVFRFDVVEVRPAGASWSCKIVENAFTLPEHYRYSPQ